MALHVGVAVPVEDVADLADVVIVMHNGKVVMTDVPRIIFSRVEELEAMGLASPQVTYLMRRLKKQGFDVPDDIIHVREAAAAIARALAKGGDCK